MTHPASILRVMRIGAHVERGDPLAEAAARDADVVQFFLTEPQGWETPPAREDADAIRSAALDVFIHAPYRINVATLNNRIRIPSRKLLLDHAKGAAALGARGLIVHGGHVNRGDDLATGIDNWRKCAERIDAKVPVLIENTAEATKPGGSSARPGVDVVGEYGAGFCLTPATYAAGGPRHGGGPGQGITGRIDLVHANDRATRSTRPTATPTSATAHRPDLLVAVRSAGAPAVVRPRWHRGASTTSPSYGRG